MFNTNTATQQGKPSTQSNKQDFGPCEPGQDAGRIVRLVGYGLQKDKGQPKNKFNAYVDKDGNPSPVTVIQVTIELPNQRIDYEDKDGVKQERPRWIFSQDIPIKFYEDYKTKEVRVSEASKIFELLTAVFPKEGNDWTVEKVQEFLPKIVGEPIGVFITNYISKTTGKAGDNIKQFMPVMRGLTVPPLENDTLYYNPYDHDEEAFRKLAPFMQERIKNRLDAEGSTSAASNEPNKQSQSAQPEPQAPADYDDDVPF